MRSRRLLGLRLWAICLLAAMAFFSGMPAPADAQAPSIAITRPQPDETLHDNTGAVAVEVTLQGATFAKGNRLRVVVDGIAHGADRQTLAFTLEALERGTHSLQVQLRDASEVLLAESPTVTFHLWQASKFLPPRKPPPLPGKK